MGNHKKTAISMWVLVLAIMLTGCGASGPTFKPVDPIPPGKGVVYIYREWIYASGAVFGTVTADKTPITQVRNGGYFPYIANPGTVHFEASSEATNAKDVFVEAGKETYLKASMAPGWPVDRLEFSEVATSRGKREIAKCKLLDPIDP